LAIADLMNLKNREIQILTLVARGETSAEIAAYLRLSKRTIDFHLNNARIKLHAKSRTQAAVIAVVKGLIKP
jgi:DNA-binding CsgD family transcriptional regulator